MLRLFTKNYQGPIENTLIIPLIYKKKWSFIDKLCVLLFIIAMICCVWLVLSFLKLSQGYNDVMYTMDTNYLNWRTPLAATSICPKQYNKFPKVSEELKEFLTTTLESNESFCPNNCTYICSDCPRNGYHKLLSKLTPSCERVIRECHWNGKPFDCCKNFHPLRTPTGRICYTLNSKLTKQSPILLELYVTQTKKDAVLKIKLGIDSEVLVHERETLEIHPKQQMGDNLVIKNNKKLKILYKVRETKVLDSARNLVLDQRKCFFDMERLHRSQYKVYSKTTCLAERLIKLQNKRCNCSHHSLHQKDNYKICGYEGLQCLNNHFNRSVLIQKSSNIKKCPERCEKQEVFLIAYQIQKGFPNERWAEIILNHPPFERILMYSTFTNLDIIVSLACIFRFTFGSNFLNFFGIFKLVFKKTSNIRCRENDLILY